MNIVASLVMPCQLKTGFGMFLYGRNLMLDGLIRYSQSGRSNDVDQSSHMLTVATSELFNDLDKSVKPVAPMQFWMVCTLFPVWHNQWYFFYGCSMCNALKIPYIQG